MSIVESKGLDYSRYNDGNYGDNHAQDCVSTHVVKQPIINPISTEFTGYRTIYLHTGIGFNL